MGLQKGVHKFFGKTKCKKQVARKTNAIALRGRDLLDSFLEEHNIISVPCIIFEGGNSFLLRASRIQGGVQALGFREPKEQ